MLGKGGELLCIYLNNGILPEKTEPDLLSAKAGGYEMIIKLQEKFCIAKPVSFNTKIKKSESKTFICNCTPVLQPKMPI